jgi:choline dehydrogenase-like flavoprotein
MAPGLGPLPPASGPDPASGTVDPVVAVEALLAAVPRRRALEVRLALRAFEWLSFPWRFSRASLAARQGLVRGVEGSGGRLSRDLVLLLKVLCGLAYGSDDRVQRAVGYRSSCAAADPPSDPPASLGDLEPGDDEECDFVVVGSGAGGAVVATVLAEAGHEVVVLEAGPYLDRRSYPREPIAALRALYREGGLTIATGRPAIPTPVGRAVGGTTVINSGTCLRTPERVLEQWASENGVGWALELDRDFPEAEEMLRVRPVDPERMGGNGQLLRRGATALEVSHGPLHRNAGDCHQCSSCPIGCRLDAKRAMHVSYLPRAVGAGARIRSGVDVRRIVFSGRSATGVEGFADGTDPARTSARRAVRFRARRGVVVSGGAFGTPELLVRSGFRSASGELGRNLRIHPACWVGARFDEPVRGWEGVMQSYAVDEWQAQGILLEATFTPLAFGGQWLPGTGTEHQERLLAFGNLASTGVHLSDRSSGRVRLRGGDLRIDYRLTRDDADRLVFGIARAAELFYAAGAREVYPQIAGLEVLARKRVAELEASSPARSALRLEAFHPMGTARMDADPRRGVVGADGAVHGAEGLYVADGSLLPSSLGVNPMMTIIAIASRLGRQIAARG